MMGIFITISIFCFVFILIVFIIYIIEWFKSAFRGVGKINLDKIMDNNIEAMILEARIQGIEDIFNKTGGENIAAHLSSLKKELTNKLNEIRKKDENGYKETI